MERRWNGARGDTWRSTAKRRAMQGGWVAELVDASADVGWTLTTLASDGAVGRNPGVALDPDGHAYVLHHIGTSPAGFQVLTNATGDWTELTRFPVTMAGTVRIGDLTVDPHGRAHVIYYDTAPDDLLYRTNGSPGASCLTWADDTTSCNAIDDDCDGTTDAGCP